MVSKSQSEMVCSIHVGLNNSNVRLSSEKLYEVSFSNEFEPYYIAKMSIPLFNSSFVDRGGNFAQQTYEMAAGGYRFFVLPKVFLLDIPHIPHDKGAGIPPSTSQSATNGSLSKPLNIFQKRKIPRRYLIDSFKASCEKYGIRNSLSFDQYRKLLDMALGRLPC